MKTEELKGRLDEGLTTVKRIGDEIRLEVHLAGMELRDKWKALEPSLLQAERAARNLSEQSLDAVDEVVKQLEDFRVTLKQSLSSARRAAMRPTDLMH
ncbi:MAG TPA: hypothetical protein VK447_05045 [Myxococcaceae bacterium]|nr:hypothetical protein [Myxococcaceae bacterium]